MNLESIFSYLLVVTIIVITIAGVLSYIVIYVSAVKRFTRKDPISFHIIIGKIEATHVRRVAVTMRSFG
jgi:hypothetical protein